MRYERVWRAIEKLLAAPEKEKKRFGLDGRSSSHFRYTNMGGDREGKEECGRGI